MIVRIGQGVGKETVITVRSGEHFDPAVFGGEGNLSLAIEDEDSCVEDGDPGITCLTYDEARALAAALIAATRGSL